MLLQIMEIIRQDTGYGLRALLEMANQDREAWLTAEQLADAAGASTDFMHKIMQSLRRAGVVASRRGPGGGFCLARRPEETTLLDVVLAVQGPLTLDRCVMGLNICKHEDCCPLGEAWSRVRQTMDDALAATTLADLAATTRTAEAGVARAAP